MTAYLNANLRHTDKRLQQSGLAVVALRHRVRARRGAQLMHIYVTGGDMTSMTPSSSWRVFKYCAYISVFIILFTIYACNQYNLRM